MVKEGRHRGCVAGHCLVRRLLPGGSVDLKQSMSRRQYRAVAHLVRIVAVLEWHPVCPWQT